MLGLADPLWAKLDDAFRDESIPGLITQLSEQWNSGVASSLFWDRLCHQDTCYGATYASVPHFLKIAEPEENRMQRLEIALFLGHVANVAFYPRTCCGGEQSVDQSYTLQGMPKTKSDWDKKLEPYRHLLSAYTASSRKLTDYEKSQIQVYRKVLSIEPVNDEDLAVIQEIEDEFLSSLSDIKVLCEKAYLENLCDEHAPLHLLAGVASASGLQALGALCKSGESGWFKCSECGWRYEYQGFDGQLAYYAEDHPPGETYVINPNEDSALLDFKECAPNRADGLVIPLNTSNELIDEKKRHLLQLAQEASDRTTSFLMQCFMGKFHCVKCGATSNLEH